jgi:hypothetical protein
MRQRGCTNDDQPPTNNKQPARRSVRQQRRRPASLAPADVLPLRLLNGDEVQIGKFRLVFSNDR